VILQHDSHGYPIGHDGLVRGRVIVVGGLRVDLVPRRHRRFGTTETFWDAYLHDLPEGAEDTPLTMGNAQATRADLVDWLHDRQGLGMLRDQAERWCIPRPRWEHGYRGHGLWMEPNTRLGYVGLGPAGTWDGVYRWHVDKPECGSVVVLEEGQAATLREAKRRVEDIAVRAWATAEAAKRPWLWSS
jgi:hypothetical protein